MTKNTQLAGKVAIVTGAAGAIGAAAVLEMLRRGASVVGVDRAGVSFEALQAQAGAGASLHIVHADVSDEPQVAAYVAEARHVFGRIDVFFNNAGIEGLVTPIADYPLATFQQVLAVNVVGVFLGLKHVIPLMAAHGGGSIVNTSSVAGLIGSPGLSAYVASKHAVIGLTRTAAIECAPMKIRVNSVNPGRLAGGATSRSRPVRQDVAMGTLWDAGGSGAAGLLSGLRRGRLHHRRNPYGGWRHDGGLVGGRCRGFRRTAGHHPQPALQEAPPHHSGEHRGLERLLARLGAGDQPHDTTERQADGAADEARSESVDGDPAGLRPWRQVRA
jgi:NAD(P)-dependent dehydrogenase (short-subunit alcohol dehydrogenase family)